MSKKNTFLVYPLALILSNCKRSFEGLGKIINCSGDTIKRYLQPANLSLSICHKIAQYLFKGRKSLILSVDDTLLRKMYASKMRGSGWFFDTKLNKVIMSYRLMLGGLTNGKYLIPIGFGFMFSKELLTENDIAKSKLEFIKEFYYQAKILFPQAVIKIAADGLFASVEILQWGIDNCIAIVVRMHSNRIVIYKGQKYKISEIASLKPHGRQRSRTIIVYWHGLKLYLTAELRIDKHDQESIVYLAATYKTRPSQYVKDYKWRWPIEKLFRTSKQNLGIAECFSINLEIQEKHVAASLLAYSIAQLERKLQKLDTPEQAIRAIKQQGLNEAIARLSRLSEIFGGFIY